jgi:polysaccharide export outer membrane protein
MRFRTILVLAMMAVTLFCRAQVQKPSETAVQPGATAGTKAAGQPANAAGMSNDSYIIGSSDMLSVTVWKQPTLSGALLVRPDGKISMPLLGDVEASGLKPMVLAAQITEKLKKFIKDPEVAVVVTSIHNDYVYLLGEVGKKGPVVMTPNMTLLEALSSAGGLTDFANKKKIYVLRTVDGKQKRIPVNYKKALKGDENYNISLSPGDTIVVP